MSVVLNIEITSEYKVGDLSGVVIKFDWSELWFVYITCDGILQSALYK